MFRHCLKNVKLRPLYNHIKSYISVCPYVVRTCTVPKFRRRVGEVGGGGGAGRGKPRKEGRGKKYTEAIKCKAFCWAVMSCAVC